MAETINLGIVGIKNMGEYDAETNYEKLNVVTYQGSSYCALKDTVGNLPTNTEYWQLYAQKGETGATGSPGPQGSTGPQGPKGETGNPGATPTVIDSVSDMVDTTKIYVLTTDGHWYYYDGNDWQDGGTYQSTGISDKAIDIWKLNDDLQDLLIKEFSGQLESTLVEGAFCYVDNGSFTIASSTLYDYYYLDLNEGDTYLFNVSNYQSVCGLLIIDTNNNNIIYNSRPEATASNPEYKSAIIKANQSNLRAYLSYKKLISYNNEAAKYLTFARKLNNVKLENFYDNTVNPIRTLTNYIGYGVSQGSVNVSPLPGSNAVFNIYPMEKGKVYEIKGFNFYSYITTIVDNNMEILSMSDGGSQSTAVVSFIMKFKAEKNGYIFANNFVNNNRNFITTVKVIKESTDESNSEINKKLKGKKWVAMGDSLTDTITLKPYSNYTNFVADEIGMVMLNYGVSGSGYMRGTNNFVAVSQTIPTDTDIVTLFGSFNDLGAIPDTDTFGQLGDTDPSTLYGAIYTTVQNIITRCPNAKIGIIAPTCWVSTYYRTMTPTAKTRVDLYIKVLEESAYYLGLPFLNLYKESNLRPWDADFRELYYKSLDDGTHPNSLGHEKYIAPLIEAFMRNKL